jgi:hypothetical protein
VVVRSLSRSVRSATLVAMPDKMRDLTKPLIYILESPSPEDVYCDRSEGQLITGLLDLLGMNYLLRNISNSLMFRHAMTDGLQADCKRLGKTPLVLHLSCHGNQDGICLTSGEVVPWAELRQLVAPLNKEVNGALLLCMSSCEGFHAFQMCVELESAPFFGIIGNTGNITWAESAIGYAVFYHQLELGRNSLEALEAVRVASGNSCFVVLRGEELQKTYHRKFEEAMSRITSGTNLSPPPGRLPPPG